jgi:hypothetical protein
MLYFYVSYLNALNMSDLFFQYGVDLSPNLSSFSLLTNLSETDGIY